jgi:PAS domain S-box-containing protein
MMLAAQPLAGRWEDSAADRFAAVLDQIPEGLGIVDHGKLIYANPPFLSSLGCSDLNQLLGHSLASVLPNFDCGVPPEKRCLPHVCPQKPLCEFDRIRPDGSAARLEASCTPFPWDGRELRIVIVRDISERERRRALHASIGQLRSIFRSIPIGLVQCSSDGRIVESNPAIEHLLGYSHDELRGMPLHDFIRGEVADRYLRLFDQTGDVQLETYQAEHRFVNRKNVEGWVRLTASLVERTKDEPSKLIAIVEEVTEYKRAERQLRDAQKMEVVGRLVGGVAHDFNNLLTGIMLYCDLLAAGLQDEKMRQHAEEIRMAGEQGAALVQQLLAINRQQVVEPRVLRMNAKWLTPASWFRG